MQQQRQGSFLHGPLIWEKNVAKQGIEKLTLFFFLVQVDISALLLGLQLELVLQRGDERLK